VLLALGHAAAGWTLGLDSRPGLEPIERAIALDPGLADAYAVKARILSDMGRYDEALRQLDTALRLDPASWLANYCAAVVRLNDGRFDEAAPYYEVATSLDETDIYSAAFLVGVGLRSESPERVQRYAQVLLVHAQSALARESSHATAMALCGMALGFLGRKEEARAWMDRALLSAPDNGLVRQAVAECLISHFDDVDTALDVLEPMLARVSRRFLGLVHSSQHLMPLRSHWRFQAMMAAAEARVAAES
jgi:tetratricopeptide (TPR) repeat protein